jgi:phage-related protein
VARSRADLQGLPQEVRRKVGYALYFAPRGEKHQAAKPLKGFGDAAVLEVVEDWDRSTYRAVYTVRFTAAVYVLHVFEKKSKRGPETPARDLALVRSRLKLAEREAGSRKEA